MSIEIFCKNAGIPSENAKLFRVVDTKADQDIHMLHFDVDKVAKQPLGDPLRNLRGMIVTEDFGTIVPSFGYTPTIVNDVLEEDWMEKIYTDKDGFKHNLKDFDVKEIFPMFDGALLRVWKYKGEVHISSHKKIDAINSRWGTSGKFVELFKKYTESIFKVEDLFPERTDSMCEIPILIHNFLLVDQDLMIASKLKFLEEKETKGCVIYIGSRNGELPIELPKIHYSEINKTSHTVFCVEKLKNLKEYNDFLSRGFYPDISTVHSNISLGEGLILSNGESMIKMVSNGYNRRSKMVNNDPNILHRCYDLLSDAAFPKEGEDDYLSRFPILPCPSDEQMKDWDGQIIDSFPEDWKIHSEEEFIGKRDREARDLRFKNCLLHYVISLPLYHQANALSCYSDIQRDRFEVIKKVCNQMDMYEKGGWEDVSPRDQKVYDRLQTVVKDGKKFARARYEKEVKDKKPEMKEKILRSLAVESIRTLLLREYGASLYKMVRVLILNEPSD